MQTIKPYLPALINWAFWSFLFLLFSRWHGAFAEPLSSEEKKYYSEKLAELNPEESPSEFMELLEQDQGKPLYMLNAIRFFEDPVKIKDQHTLVNAREAMEEYNNYVMSFLIKRGSYPIYSGDAIGVTAAKWGLDYKDEWSTGAIVRYRSLRTMLDMALDPKFREKHYFKKAAIEQTLAYPTEADLVAGNLGMMVFFILLSAALGTQLILNGRRHKIEILKNKL